MSKFFSTLLSELLLWLVKPLRSNWNFAFPVLLVSVWLLTVSSPGWTQSLQAKQIVDYSPQVIAYIFAIHAIIIVTPVGIVFWRRQVALQSAKRDPTAIWFSYAKTLNWSVWGMWILWISANFGLKTGNFVDFVLAGNVSLPSQWAIKLSLFFLPPALVFIACHALSHPVYTKISGVTDTQKDVIWQTFLEQAFVYLSIILFRTGISACSVGEVRLGIVLLVVACVCLEVAFPILIKARNLNPYALSVGELRDRVFALAEVAGVNLQQIYVFPANKGRLVEAFSSNVNTIVFTDYFLEKFSKQEVDAIIAHELGHLKRCHPGNLALITIMTGGTFGIVMVLFDLFAFLPITFGLTLLVFYFVSKQYENTADIDSVAIAKNPEALITAIVKLAPLKSEKQTSTLKRVQKIARRANISPAQSQDILNNCDRTQTERYELPLSIFNEDPIFSLTFKSNLIFRNYWIGIVVRTLTPALVAFLAQLVDGNGKTAIYLVGIFLTLGLHLVIADFVNGWGYADLQHRLSKKLQREGIDIKNAHFVSFAPASQPRIYEGFFDWDIGFLFIGGKGLLGENCLCYVGEQTRFTLYPEQVSDIKSGLGYPSWWKNAYIYVTWYDKDRDIRDTFNFHLSGEHSTRMQEEKAIRALNQQLKAWWEEGRRQGELKIPNFLAELGTPGIGSVTSRSISDLLKSINFINSMEIPVMIAIAFSLLFGLSLAGCYVVLVTILAHIFAMIPYWRYREDKVFIPSI
jgi:Zn-dependent protease with chaperone function